MIPISVDEGAAFDILSILTVKAHRGGDTHEAIARLHGEISQAIGTDLFQAVITSPECSSLYDTNLALFDLIDAFKERGERVGDAVQVDQLNYRRYQLKRALQERFFPTNPLTEVKLGYTT